MKSVLPATAPSAPAGAAGAEEAHAEGRTRDRVARSILENGPSTAAALADRLGLTSAAVRRHLDALSAAGLVAADERRSYGQRGRGRPARAYGLTEAGRGAFAQDYDQLATDALRFLEQSAGDEAVSRFARRRAGEAADRYEPALHGLHGRERLDGLAAVLSADGFAASTVAAPHGAGAQLCQHHCPVAHVAAEFPALCEAEAEVFARLLGTHVQRLATIARGQGICTTYVPDPERVTTTSTSRRDRP